MRAEFDTGTAVQAHDNFVLLFIQTDIADGASGNTITTAGTTNLAQLYSPTWPGLQSLELTGSRARRIWTSPADISGKFTL